MAKTSNRLGAASFVFVACLLLLGVVGCGNQEQQETAAATDTEAVSVLGTLGAADADLVKKAAAIALVIETNPTTAAQVLAANGMTAKDFEDLIYRISADEKLSAAYEEARK